MSTKEHKYYLYILASKRNGTLCIGVSNSLFRRTLEHKLTKNKESFTSKYNVKKLVYYEVCGDINMAIQREKQMKKWEREWKIRLIEKSNPIWRDLFQDME